MKKFKSFVDSSILMKSMSPFPVLGVSSVLFSFLFPVSRLKTLSIRSAAYDLGLVPVTGR